MGLGLGLNIGNRRGGNGITPPLGNEYVKVDNTIVTVSEDNTKLYVTT